MWKCEAGGPEVGVEESGTLLKHSGGTGRSSGSLSQVARLTTQWSVIRQEKRGKEGNNAYESRRDLPWRERSPRRALARPTSVLADADRRGKCGGPDVALPRGAPTRGRADRGV